MQCAVASGAMPSEYRFACISTLSDFGSFLQETGRYNENTVERYVNFVKKFVVTEADKVDDLKIAYETVGSKAFAKNVREVYAYDKGQRGKARAAQGRLESNKQGAFH